MPFLHLHMMQFETVYSLISFNSTSFTQRIPCRDPSELYGYLLREQVVRGETKRFLRNLNRRREPRGGASALCSFRLTRSGRFCLTANDPLGHRFLRSPVPYRTQKLSSSVPMVLDWQRSGRVGRLPQSQSAQRVSLTLQPAACFD